MKILQPFLDLLKSLMILVAFAYAVLTLFTVVFDYLLVITTFFELTGINGDFFLTDNEVGSDVALTLYDSVFYNITYVISTFAAILGMMILSRRRTLIEAAGMLLAFIIPPERKSWGKILDSTNLTPIPFAQVYLEPLNGQNNVIKTIADSDGRYKLVLPDKKYSYVLSVKAPGYKDDVVEIRTAESPIYGNEYIKDIFLHQVGKSNRNIFAKIGIIQSKLYWYLTIFLVFLSFVYFLFALYYIYAFPGSFYGALNLAIMVFALGWNIVMIKDRLKPKIGKVLDLKTRRPILGVGVYLYKKDIQLEVRKTDSAGVVNFSLEPGAYEVRLAKDGYKTSIEGTFQEVELKQDGFLDTNLFMEKVSATSESAPVDFNPFA